jgi:formylglycine-generating enzyme required for sulfatase activity
VGDGVLTISAVEGSEAWLTGEFPAALPVIIQPGASGVMIVSVNASSLTAGAYAGVLSIGSNDADDPVLPVGISATVPRVEMVSIPGGTFQMGSTSSWGSQNEQPVHEVTVREFLMAKYEVTNEEMRAVMQWAYDNGKVNASGTTVTNAEGNAQELLDLNGYCEISFSGGVFTVDSGKQNRPCGDVTWYGGQAFCNYLSDMEGLQRCISFNDWSCTWTANGYRLPTEAEWEYACRATSTTDYYNGDETAGGWSYDPNLDAIGWYYWNETGWTNPVGQKQANQWGLKDMSGNVCEWCWDWWGAYSDQPQTDPTGPTGGSGRVKRGGGWDSGAEVCRSAFRSLTPPAFSYYWLGFRPARR